MEIKGKSLKLVFFEYLISIVVAVAISVVISLLIYGSLFATGFIVASDYTEDLIIENKNKIRESENFNEKLLPEKTKYIFISKTEHILKTNMNTEEEQKAIKFHKGDLFNSESSSYMEIERKDGIVIVNYSLKPYYENAWMNRNFPDVNIFLLVILIALCILAIFIATLFWANKVSNELKPMLKASEKISKKDLDFKIETTDIKEFNVVLNSLDSMKIALEQSLKKEWVNAEMRKNQISSLTHDLKTPLSIVQGNAQLLKETNLDAEQEQLVDYIIKNSKRLTDYIKTLMIVNKTDNLTEITLQEVHSKDMANSITQIAYQICIANNRKLKNTIEINDRKIKIDQNLIERAVSNIIINSIEYSPDGTDIELSISENEKFLEIKISDQGKGFTKSDLKNATEQFYRGDNSRNSTNNFGMGLFIADKIMNLHKGKLLLSNKKERGAVVTLEIPFD